MFDLKLGTVFIECLIPTLQIDREVVRPHIPELLEALLICFNDDSWPVRDGRLSLEISFKLKLIMLMFSLQLSEFYKAVNDQIFFYYFAIVIC